MDHGYQRVHFIIIITIINIAIMILLSESSISLCHFSSFPGLIACERQTFLLTCCHLGLREISQGGMFATQRQKFHTDNAKSVRIQSEALIGRQSNFIVLAIVYK